jgi:hypothetical protein
MKNFFISTCGKIGRFFWSWGVLKFVLWTVTLVILFYVEEDWRGARVWAATKEKWEAKGESFDLNKFTPPQIPDDENLTALPIFRMEYSPGDNSQTTRYPLALRQAMRSNPQALGGDLPPRGNWMRGELPNMPKIHDTILTDYLAAFPGSAPPHDALDQWDALYPFLSDLRGAAATRPLCRLDLDYSSAPPAGRALGLLTDQLRLSQILTIHALLAMQQHQSDVALQDITINYRVLDGAARNPTLVGGLVALGINAVDGTALYDGLALHVWSDAQLNEIQQMLAQVDFLAIYQFDYRSMAADSVTNIEYFKHVPLDHSFGLFHGPGHPQPNWIRYSPPWPGGWWDSNKSQMADYTLHELDAVNPPKQRALPKVNHEMQAQDKEAAERWDAYAPWNIWFTLAIDSMSGATQKFAYGQNWINEAQIACALERYRLAKGVYPNALTALPPTYITELPHDIMSGEQYHYSLRPGGTFLLYSIGWNLSDEGGKIIYEKDNPNRIDSSQGDWGWPTPQPDSAK